VQSFRPRFVLALLFPAGLAWGPVLAPGSGSPIVTAGRAAAASLLVAAVTCTVLASLGALTPVAIVAALLALTGLPFLLPGRRRDAARWLHGVVSRRRGRRAVTLALGVVGVGVALALVILPSRAAVGDAFLPFSSTVWYYANLARETALGGGFPTELPEWGTLRPFQTDYLPVTAHTAAAFALLPGLDVQVTLEAYRLAVLAATFAAAVLLFRRFVSIWLAVLGACLLLATVRLEGKFLAYRPETWALVPALFTLWLADRAMVERSWRLAAAAVVAAAVVWLAHAEVFLLLGPGVVGLAAARLLAARGRVGLRIPPRSALVPVAAVAGAVLAGGLLVGTIATYGLTGELRVLGYVARDRDATEAPAPPPADEMPPGWTFTDDPTWDFYVAAVAPGQQGREPPSSFTDRRLLPRSILHVWPGLDARLSYFLVVLAGLLLARCWPGRSSTPDAGDWCWQPRSSGLPSWPAPPALRDLRIPASRTHWPRRLMPYVLVLPVVAGHRPARWSLSTASCDPAARPSPRGALVASRLALLVLTIGMTRHAPGSFDEDLEPGSP
jgi:hypothetical protein